MTLQELLTDLKAAGANENTIRLAMNCYELGRVNESEAIKNAIGLMPVIVSELPAITKVMALIHARGQA